MAIKHHLSNRLTTLSSVITMKEKLLETIQRKTRGISGFEEGNYVYIHMLRPKCDEKASAAEVTPNMWQYEQEIGPKKRGRMGVFGAILGSDICV
jgi:hypothetical protein